MSKIIASAALLFAIVSGAPQRIRLTEVQSLVFNRDAFTLGRRSDSLPQLICTGGPCDQYGPPAVLCTNVGSNGVDVNWKCEAEHTGPVKFKQLTVSCEGYEYPQDPYILSGSCALEYSLEFLPSALSSIDVEDPLLIFFQILAFTMILVLCAMTLFVVCHYCNTLSITDHAARVVQEDAPANSCAPPPSYYPTVRPYVQQPATAPLYEENPMRESYRPSPTTTTVVR